MALLVAPLAAAPPRLSAPDTILTTTSWVFRENRVPHYQREFQKHDGLRTWEKVRGHGWRSLRM
jgi:hypothetical protein